MNTRFKDSFRGKVVNKKLTFNTDKRTLDSVKPQRLLLELCAEHQIPCLDLLPILKTRSNMSAVCKYRVRTASKTTTNRAANSVSRLLLRRLSKISQLSQKAARCSGWTWR